MNNELDGGIILVDADSAVKVLPRMLIFADCLDAGNPPTHDTTAMTLAAAFERYFKAKARKRSLDFLEKPFRGGIYWVAWSATRSQLQTRRNGLSGGASPP